MLWEAVRFMSGAVISHVYVVQCDINIKNWLFSETSAYFMQ